MFNFLILLIMEKKSFSLSNGMSVVFVNAKDSSVCLSVNVGHVNEPRTGLANLFEKTLLMQVKGIEPVFGGTMTAYKAYGDDFADALEKVAQVFTATVVNEEFVQKAKDEIRKSTLDSAPMIMRRMKLEYKHVAFSSDKVVSTEEYLRRIDSYSVEDVRAFANTYYTGKNAVLVIAGNRSEFDRIKAMVKDLFSAIPAGKVLEKVKGDIYTGGFGRLDCSGEIVRLMFGFDVNHLTIDDSPAANVMMTMFWRRLERALAEAGIDAQVEFKIAGYYGLRTMRALIVATAEAKQLTEIFVAAVNRICDEDATDERMERSRTAAMQEKLDKYEKADDTALEVAWQMIGRGHMYDPSDRIMNIGRVDAEAVRDIAGLVFRRSVPTYIVAVDPAAEVYSLDELKEMLSII